MAYQQVATQPAQQGRYAGPPLDPGQTMAVRRRAVGINPQSTALFITRPALPGLAASWTSRQNFGFSPDGSINCSNNQGVFTQGLPAIQNGGAGFRGSHSFGNPGTNPDRRVGLRKDTLVQGNPAAPDYFFLFNGYAWSCCTAAAGGVATPLASGIGQPKDVYSIGLYDNRVEFLVAGQVVCTVNGAPVGASFYPCVYVGATIAGMVATWCKLLGNLARGMRYADYVFGGSWNDVSTGDNSSEQRTALTGNWTEYIDIRITKGIKLFWPQGRGVLFRIYLNGTLLADNGSDVISYELVNLDVPEAGFNTLRVQFKDATYFTIDPQYSLIYL